MLTSVEITSQTLYGWCSLKLDKEIDKDYVKKGEWILDKLDHIRHPRCSCLEHLQKRIVY